MYDKALVGIFVFLSCLIINFFCNIKYIKIFSLIVYFFYVIYNNILPVYLICLACIFHGVIKLTYKNKSKILNIIVVMISLIFYFYLQGHKFPGVLNVLVAKNILIGQQGVPWDLYVNHDKVLISFLGLFNFIGFIKNKPVNFKCIEIVIFLLIVLIMTLSLSTKFIKYDFKIDPILLLWSINNLCMVCISEEIFFRHYLYNMLIKINFFNKYNNLLSILFSSLLFGLFHYQGGIIYVILAFLAGIVYCLLYICSKKIHISILGHFMLNLMHFIFFSYPKAL